MDKYLKTIRLFPDKEKTLNDIKNHLQKFTGGSVNLQRRDDGLAVVTLDHKARKNAMSGKMMVDLFNVVEELESWKEGKGVILKGSEESFCSGGDLNFVRATGTAEEGFMMSTLMHNALKRFQRLPLVSVALIEGTGAIGGGAEISAACDFRIISEKCQGIGFVQAKMGLIPAWGGTNLLVEKLGYKKALKAILTAQIMNPSECLRLGLVDEIIPEHENCKDFAIAWMKDKTNFNCEIIRAIKATASMARDFPNSFETESRIFAQFWGGPANKEALSKNIKHKAENQEK